jgi:hypothetical protein
MYMLRRGWPLGGLVLAATLVAAVALAGGTAPPAASAGPPSYTARWAVLVGVNDFAGRTHDLAGSVGDVDDTRQVLLDHGWPADHILTLTDAQATAANIRSAFRWLQSNSTDSSFSVFHYSSHVKRQSGDLDGDGEDVDEYLWPHDNVFIADREFTNAMRAVRGWLWVDVAACHAAGLDDGITTGDTHRLFTASSQESEKSYEDPSKQNSVMGFMLIDLHADRPGDARRPG